MKAGLGGLARPFLQKLDPETAHGLALRALKLWPFERPPADNPALAVDAFGLRFKNPLGMAAGFDKNAEAPHALIGLGFGFAEVGTLTPRPQAGNPRPRVFRLGEAGALINRLGFNNQGYEKAHARLAGAARQKPGIVGVNIGANKDSADRAGDYALGIRTFADVAAYFTINVSSPNTPGLRDLQRAEALDALIARVLDAREAMAEHSARRPVLVKIAPDLTLAELDAIVGVARARRVDGMIVSNTTIARPAGLGLLGTESGGLSGRPLFEPATRLLAQTFSRVEGQFPLVGVGGVDSTETAYAKIRAGAHLIQLYTALVFGGPGLIGAIKTGLAQKLAADHYSTIGEAVGVDAASWRGLSTANAARLSGP